jgi:phospholipid/cholesterol/gamma-HCH transport system permease protein
LGQKAIRGVKDMGAWGLFFGHAFLWIFRPRQARRIGRQLYLIGATTTPIVILIGLFTGMVMALQLYYALVKFGSEAALGTTVALAVVRELGPVLTAIMITARAGSAMTAEIGIQRINEQIDALYTMRIDPLGYLVSPRIAAALVSFPLLTAIFDVAGIVGGHFTGVMLLGTNAGAYWSRVDSSLVTKDVAGGFVKAVVFAAIVSTVCCYRGFYTHMRHDSRGARAVSRATTEAVVLSCVLILISDYVVTSFLL